MAKRPVVLKPDFSVDLEVNRLEEGQSAHSVRRDYGKVGPQEDIYENLAAHQKIIPTEVAIIDHGRGIAHNTIVDNVYSPADAEFDAGRSIDLSTVFRGQKVPGRFHVKHIDARKDIQKLFNRPNSRGMMRTSREQEMFFSSIFPKLQTATNQTQSFFQIALGQQRQIVVSSFSKKYLEQSAQEISDSVAASVRGKTGHQVKTKVVNLDAFGNVVNDYVSTLLNRLNEKNAAGITPHGGFHGEPVYVGAWGAEFEARRWATWVAQKADPVLKQAYETAVRTGTIQYFGLEQGFVDVMYGLARENKDIMSNLKIPVRASTFHEFGWRIGKTPANYQEFAASVSWSQDFVGGLSSWWKPAKALAEGTESHRALVDILKAPEIADLYERVLTKTYELAKADWIPAGTSNQEFIERLAKAPTGRKYFKEALEHVMFNDDFSAIKGDQKAVEAQLAKFTDTVVKKAKQSGKYATEMISKAVSMGGGGGHGGYTGIGSIKNILGDLKNVNKKSLWSFGTLGGLVALTVASTYFSNNEYEGGLGKKVGKGLLGKYQPKSLKSYQEDNTEAPYYHTQFFSQFVPGATITAASFALFGLREAQMTGNLFGAHRTLFNKTDGFMQWGKDAGALMRLGVKAVESNFPIFRVFKAGQLTDYIAGARNYGEKANGKYKAVRNVIYDRLHPNKAHRANMDVFMDAIKISNPAEANELEQIITQSYDGKSLDRVSVYISRTKDGRAHVSVEEVGLDGAARRAAGWQQGKIFDVEPTFISTSTGNLKRRGVKPSLRGTDEDYNFLQSSLAKDYFDKTQTDLGLMTPKSFEEYLFQFNKPSYVTGPKTESIWRAGKRLKWMLSLDSKGINESSNALYNTASSLGRIRTIVGVKGIKGGVLDNLKYKNQYWGGIGRELISGANRFLESPFETFFVNPSTFTKVVNTYKGSASPTKQILGRMMGFIERPHLGLNLNAMKYGLPQFAAEVAAKRVLPLALGFYGIGLVDKLLGAATFSPTGRGPLVNAPIKAYESAMLAYSKVSDILGLTTINKKQERYAPGSTGLGFFAPAMALTAGYSASRFLYKSAPQSMRDAGMRFARSVETGRATGYSAGSFIGRAAEAIGRSNVYRTARQYEAYKGALNKPVLSRIAESFIRSPKKTIFGLGMALMLPFVPGFIGSSKSYAERKAEFQGEKDVAIRKNRGWFLSSQPFVGERVSQYRQSATSLIKSNWENRGVIWPSYTKRLMHAMTLGMYDRYMLEDYHATSQPVYESAPYGGGVPIFGPLISQTLGRILKPVRVLHTQDEDVVMPDHSGLFRAIAQSSYKASQATDMNVMSNLPVDPTTGIGFTAQYAKSEHAPSSSTYQFMRQLNDMVGFKGFLIESMMKTVTGKDAGDEFTPYMQSAKQMYNPSQYMWQYQAGDVSIIGGEFLRRIFVAPEKKWTINNLPNELMGQSWIPDRFHTGTTFDKMPMGFLYASRKGWEFQHPEIKGMEMDQYPDEIKLQILKYMAPKSREFDEISRAVIEKAMGNHLTPRDEQMAYEAMAQKQELMKTLNAHGDEASYELQLEEESANITGLDMQSGTFTVDKYGDRKFRLAGVSTALPDIRASLLKSNVYSNSSELDAKAKEIQANLYAEIESHMSVGSKINMSTAAGGSFSGTGEQEAIVGGLNESLLDAGSPMMDTGNISTHNMQQDQSAPGSKLLAKYWNALSDHNSFFIKKMIGNRDYLTEYKSNRVYSREVRLWTKPIEHFVKPFISSIFSNVGMKITPSFTKKRREQQQYWDVIKYIKYKTLATHSMYNNNTEEAAYYEQLSKETMVGANPLEDLRSTERALPYGERDYFKYFANEPDPKKRAKIDKYLPKAAQRIYEAIWISNQARSGNASEEVMQEYEILQKTGGYSISEDEYKEWQSDTGGEMPLDDYVRARFVREYAKTHDIPAPDWVGWSEATNIENVELLALKDAGEQVQDYGYFDEQIRKSAFDKLAYISSSQMSSRSMTDSQFNGSILPNLVSQSGLDTSYGMPTNSISPINGYSISSNAFDKSIHKNHHIPWFALGALDDIFYIGLALSRL